MYLKNEEDHTFGFQLDEWIVKHVNYIYVQINAAANIVMLQLYLCHYFL